MAEGEGTSLTEDEAVDIAKAAAIAYGCEPRSVTSVQSGGASWLVYLHGRPRPTTKANLRVRIPDGDPANAPVFLLPY